MKQRKFILLFLCLLILLGGYATWCAREFFLHPKIARGPDIPAEAWTAIEQHFAEEGFPVPRFRWKRYGYLLAHPYESPFPAQSMAILSMPPDTMKGIVEIHVFHRDISFEFRRSETNYWKSNGAIWAKN